MPHTNCITGHTPMGARLTYETNPLQDVIKNGEELIAGLAVGDFLTENDRKHKHETMSRKFSE